MRCCSGAENRIFTRICSVVYAWTRNHKQLWKITLQKCRYLYTIHIQYIYIFRAMEVKYRGWCVVHGESMYSFQAAYNLFPVVYCKCFNNANVCQVPISRDVLPSIQLILLCRLKLSETNIIIQRNQRMEKNSNKIFLKKIHENIL